MTVRQFIESRIPAFRDLGPPELQAVEDFSLLWSVFENQVCDTNASPSTLVAIPKALARRGTLDMAPFREALIYFQNRYCQEGRVTQHFEGLRLPAGRAKDAALVTDLVLGTANLDREDVLAGMLLIVYRYRNNLFHGDKWYYGMVDQRENFKHACDVLMAVMTQYGGPE